MPDYTFYRDVYEGSQLSEPRFRELSLRGREWLEKLERCCRVTPYGTESRKMAICSVAETLAAWERRNHCLEESVGSVRVRYQKNDLPLQRQLLQNVSGYVEVYRGVS